MTDHVFGTIAGDEDLGGVFNLGDAVLLREYASLAVETLSETQNLPAVALELFGRVNKSQDTVRVNYVISVLDAGCIAGFLYNAVKRLGDDPLLRADFGLGFATGSGGRHLDDEEEAGS